MQASKVFSKFLNFYHQNGYVVFPQVIKPQLCRKAIQQHQRIKLSSGFLSRASKDINLRTHNNSNFFVDRFNRVSYFFENTYSDDKTLDMESMIKVGHALHLNKVFEQITYSRQVQDALEELQITDPLIVQSMLLEKLPRKGGKVTMHQDSTYLLNEPDTIKGYWIPFQDVNKENGCIWVIPGSHKSKLYYKFKIVNGEPKYQIDGPIDYKQEDSVPIEMKKGDLLVLNGRILHKSNDNISKNSRYAYTWHTIEKQSKWFQGNWKTFEQIVQENPRNSL